MVSIQWLLLHSAVDVSLASNVTQRQLFWHELGMIPSRISANTPTTLQDTRSLPQSVQENVGMLPAVKPQPVYWMFVLFIQPFSQKVLRLVWREKSPSTYPKFWEQLILSLIEIIQGVSEIGSHINTHEKNSHFRHQCHWSCDTCHKRCSKCPSCTLKHVIDLSIFWHLKWSTKKASARDRSSNWVTALFWCFADRESQYNLVINQLDAQILVL